MGPNGSGKSTLSHVIMGKPGYEVLGGTVTLDGEDLLALPPWQRAQAGLFLAMQYPTEVPGVSRSTTMLTEALVAAGRRRDRLAARLVAEAGRIGFDERFLDRPLNVDLSGGEKKRNETLQLGVLAPEDRHPRRARLRPRRRRAARLLSRRIEQAATDETASACSPSPTTAACSHELKPDRVHVLARGRIQAVGGPELADELELAPATPATPRSRRPSPSPVAPPTTRSGTPIAGTLA